MRKRTILAALTIVMMLFTMIPATVTAAQAQSVGEEYNENLEYVYMSSIKDRSKYCDDVWAEIQSVYKEGRNCYANLENDDEWWDVPDYETMLMELGKLTWVKSYDDLATLKTRLLKEINDEYKLHKKSDYSEYSWDMIQDYLYVGKKQINKATTFADVTMGYAEAMVGMTYATTKEELKIIKQEEIDALGQLINLYLDSDDYIKSTWDAILAAHDEAVAAIKAAELEYELDEIIAEYTEMICNLAGLDYPLTYEAITEIFTEIMEPAIDFYEGMNDVDYTWERIDQADEIMWDLEEDVFEAKTRKDADAVVTKALNKLKALPLREYDENFCKTYVIKAKAAGASGTSVKVTWNASKDLDGYLIYRSNTKNGTYKLIKEIYNGKTKSYVDKGLTYGKNYFYKVKGMKYIDWEETYTKLSAPVKATPKLVAPAVKLSKTGKNSVQLKWNKVPGADGYQIYRSTSINGQFKLVKTIKKGSTVKWKDTSTKKGKTYCYKMRSYDVQKNGVKKFSGYGTIKTIKR